MFTLALLKWQSVEAPLEVTWQWNGGIVCVCVCVSCVSGGSLILTMWLVMEHVWMRCILSSLFRCHALQIARGAPRSLWEGSRHELTTKPLAGSSLLLRRCSRCHWLVRHFCLAVDDEGLAWFLTFASQQNESVSGKGGWEGLATTPLAGSLIYGGCSSSGTRCSSRSVGRHEFLRAERLGERRGIRS
jgi:hypothetical protein